MLRLQPPRRSLGLLATQNRLSAGVALRVRPRPLDIRDRRPEIGFGAVLLGRERRELSAQACDCGLADGVRHALSIDLARRDARALDADQAIQLTLGVAEFLLREAESLGGGGDVGGECGERGVCAQLPAMAATGKARL